VNYASSKNNFLVLWLILAVLLLTTGGITAYSLYNEHGLIDLRERERLATQTKVIDENLAIQLNGVYLALKDIRNDLGDWRKKNDMGLANHHLTALCDAMPGVRTIFITNAAGEIIAASRKQLVGQDISYREYFQTPFKSRNLSTLYISPPFKTLSGNYVINATVVVPGANGAFAGVVAATLNPDYCKALLSSVLYAPDMWSAIAHGDGKHLLMVPDNPEIADADLAKQSSFFMRHQKSRLPATVMIDTLFTTGEVRMLAQRTIKPENVPMDKPLVVAVGRGVSALYAGWHREALGKGSLFGVLVLSMTSALFFYQRRQQRIDALSAGVVEELIQTREAALRANTAKSRFLATVAHEFRTPLSILTSSTDILDRYGERLNREERAEQQGRIRNAAQLMSDLVDSVLSFNRLAVLTPQSVPVALDVGRFCRTLAGEVKSVYSKQHDFQVTIAADCGTALLDRLLFRRIVENLLTNAFRYTSPGGVVSLNVTREGDKLRVVVTDSGIGIPEECRKRVFEAFYRGSNVEDRRGLGLGLSIVHDALSHMGGSIYIDSAVGRGTTIRVEIPVVDQSDTEGPSCTQS